MLRDEVHGQGAGTGSSCSTRRTATGRRLEERLAAALPAVVADSGRVVIETTAKVSPTLPLDLVTTRRYGSARITIFTP